MSNNKGKYKILYTRFCIQDVNVNKYKKLILSNFANVLYSMLHYLVFLLLGVRTES
jgi:hypothetical protein